jgi:hypothetical protein
VGYPQAGPDRRGSPGGTLTSSQVAPAGCQAVDTEANNRKTVRLGTSLARGRAPEFLCEPIDLFEVFDLVVLIDLALEFSARVECLGQPLQAWEGSHERILSPDHTNLNPQPVTTR